MFGQINSTILITIFPANYRLQICCPRSTTSVKLSIKHSGHMGQKFITYSVSCVMSRNSRENGITTKCMSTISNIYKYDLRCQMAVTCRETVAFRFEHLTLDKSIIAQSEKKLLNIIFWREWKAYITAPWLKDFTPRLHKRHRQTERERKEKTVT